MQCNDTVNMQQQMDKFLKKKKQECSALLIDIENYNSAIKDFGPMFVDGAMDWFLYRISECLKDLLMFIMREGKSSFFILMNKMDSDVADVIEKAMKNCYMGEKGGKRVVPVCRIGVASGVFDDFEDAIQKAGKALAVAKKYSRKIYYYHDAIDGVVVSRAKPYIPSNHGECNIEFLAFSASLLANAISIKSSVNLLIGMIGIGFDVNSVLINEYNMDKGTMDESYLWIKEDGIVKPDKVSWDYNQWDGFMKGFDRDGFMAIEDTSVGFSERDKSFFDEKGIKAAINCLLYSGTKLNGYISLCDCERTRKWTEYEKRTIYELSKLIAAFLDKRRGIREDKRAIEQLSIDPLTSLMSFPLFMQEASKQYSKNSGSGVCAVTYADVNNFAYVNENFGFFEGNKILTMFANRLNEYPQIGCRVSADRFLTFCHSDDRETIINTVSAINDDVNAQIRARFPVSDLRITTGIYFLNPEGDDIQSGIEKANAIRKMIKNDRSQSYAVYTEELNEKKKKELEIIGSVHNAIKDGEIVAYLQPKYSLSTQEVLGAEALARWCKKDGTMMSPADFIPLLERVGYIVDVDYCIYEQVLQCLARWKKEGKKLIPISVNFSRKHTNNPNFVDNVCELAEKYGVDRKYIEIEITESTISDNDAMIRNIDNLRKSGFKVDIDDFGTGYSSLDMLMDIPVDIVKIDKRFIDKSDSEKGRVYIKQIADLISASRKDIIFEGVETQNQADFLLDSGYSKIQGYYFDAPIPIGDFEIKYMN